ncbi:protein translocase subunit [Blyttiomyces sp. JEL0837]|nr:protein translocase subunit [Blyttiomyces sp. JEL0837]
MRPSASLTTSSCLLASMRAVNTVATARTSSSRLSPLSSSSFSTISRSSPLTTTIRTTIHRTTLTSTSLTFTRLTQSRLYNTNKNEGGNNGGGGGGGGGSGGGNVNFFSEFMRSFRRQVEENKEFQQNVKLLSDKTTEIAESDTMKRAKDAMSKGAEGTSKVVQGISAVAGKVGEGVGVVLESTPVKKTVEVVGKVGETVQKVAVDPLLETKTAKTIATGIHHIQKDLSSNSPALEYRPKEIRERERAQQASSSSSARATLPNPEAGGSVVLAKESKWQQAWREFQETNPVAVRFSSLAKSIEESENPVVERVREAWYRVSSVMDETEEARCVKSFREVEPGFRRESFLKEASDYIIPEILEAHLKGDLNVIRTWCSEKVYAELAASVELQRTAGLVSDCKLLDLSRVDIRKFMFLEDQFPVIILSFATQELLLFRDRKTGEVKLGSEDHIDSAFYSVALTKTLLVDPEAKFDPATNGWKVITWSRAAGGF